MGKRWKKRFRDIFCWNTTSSDSDIENEDGSDKITTEEAEPSVFSLNKKPTNMSDMDYLKLKVEEIHLTLERKVGDLSTKLEAHNQWLRDTISKYLVPKKSGMEVMEVQPLHITDILSLKPDVSSDIKYDVKNQEEVDGSNTANTNPCRPSQAILESDKVIDFDKCIINTGNKTPSPTELPTILSDEEDEYGRKVKKYRPYIPFRPPKRRNDIIDFDKYIIKKGTVSSSSTADFQDKVEDQFESNE